MTDGIQIERSRHAQEFVIIGNAEARDNRLSLRARGLHHYLLSLPSGWRTTTTKMSAEMIEGREAIRSALNELATLGYVTRNKRQDERGRWSTTMTVHDKPQVSAGDTEDGFPGVGGPGVGSPVPGGPGVGEPGAIKKTEPKTVKEDDPKMVSSSRSAGGRARRETNGAAQPRSVASRQARASGTSVRVLTSQDKIDGTRSAIAAIYGESWNRTISDEEALALFEMKAPARKRVTNVTAYMTKIFEDTPAFDTLLSQLDTELAGLGDDYDQAHDVQPFPPCPRCGGMRAEIDPARGVCALCARELVVNGGGSEWNVSIIQAVRTALFVTTGKTMDDDWCARVAGHILTDDKGRARKFSQAGVGPKVKYITTTISTDDRPERFLPTPTPRRVA